MATEIIQKGEYYIDRGTGKIELHFDKESYMALPQDLRNDIKRYFLFSRGKGAWISKGQANTWMPQEIVKKLGFQKTGEIGEKVSFAEKMEAKAERAAERAERYEAYSASARQRQQQLQKQFNELRGDIAFLTQPGRFAWRDKIVARYEKGFAEAEKAKHFAEQSERLEKVSTQSQLKNPVYLDNRIKQGEAELRKVERTAEEYRQKGREVPQSLEDRATTELDKLMFYKKAMGDIGGVKYSQANITKGDKVKTRFDWGIVKSTGPKNMTIMFTEGGARGMELKLPYAEIKEHQAQKQAEPKPSTADVSKMVVGEQTGALGVPQKVVTQKSTGRPITADMEAYAKLQQARSEASPKPPKSKEDVRELLGTLSHEDATELAAGLDLRIDELDRRIDQGKATMESIKESLDPRIAKLTPLIPTTKEGRSEITHITKGQYKKVWGKEPPASIVTKGKVRWEYALDTIAQELHLEPKAQNEGKAPDEYLKGLIEDAKDTKELIRATEAEVRSDESTLKALDKLKDTIKARTAKATTGPLLQKFAKAPKVKATTKPKPETRAKTMLAGVAQALIDKTQAKRTPRALLIDNSLLAKQVVPISKVELWAKNPNRLDIRGVDTPGCGRIVAGVAYADKGKKRLARKRHKGWRKVKFT